MECGGGSIIGGNALSAVQPGIRRGAAYLLEVLVGHLTSLDAENLLELVHS